MYCAICKKWMDSDDLVCPECEALLRQRQTPPAPQPPQPTPVELQPPQPYYQAPTPTPVPSPIPTPVHVPTPAPMPLSSSQPDPLNRMFGFGKALAATILGFIGFITSYVGIMMLVEMAQITGYYSYDMTSGVVALLMALPCFIIALILGIQSISCFKKRKDTCAKNIPTLVLGIVGVALAGLTALYLCLLSIMLMALA